jgi:predicted nucleotide-binding protein
MVTKPTAFCGSSSESLRLVHEIQAQLVDTAKVKSWKTLFKPGDYVLERLLSLVNTFDYGIFVFTADDTVEIRKKRFLVSRDNVVLELGLFMERLGRHRTFIVVQEVPGLRLPSDLDGLVVSRVSLPPQFSGPKGKKVAEISPTALTEALTPTCHDLRNAMLEQREQTFPRALSGGMVYLLRHLESRTPSVAALTPALIFFQTKKKDSLPEAEQRGWKKATQYALQGLFALDFVEVFDGGR